MPTVTRKQLADDLGLSPNRVSELSKMGVLRKLEDGTYNLEDSKARYAAYNEDAPANSETVLAKARLIEERARQTYLKFMRLRGALLPTEVVRTLYSVNRAVCRSVLAYFAEAVSDKSPNIADVREMGLAIHEEVSRSLNAICDQLPIERLFTDNPQLKELFNDPAYTFTLDGLAPADALREARLQKLEWLTRYEKVRTGVMTGEFIPVHVVNDLAGKWLINAKSRLTSVPTATAPLLINKSKADALELLREYTGEVLDEVRPFDLQEYRKQIDGFVMELEGAKQATNEPEGEE